MTNRTLTALALRFAALLILMKIIEQFGSFILSVYWTAFAPFFSEVTNTAMDKTYYNYTLLISLTLIVSGILFFKAEWVTSKIIKEDVGINIGLTPEKLIRVILLTTGVIWIAHGVYLIPDIYDYIQMLIAKHNREIAPRVDFNPVYYLMKIIMGLLFIFRIDQISSYLEKKMNNKETTAIIQEENNGS